MAVDLIEAVKYYKQTLIFNFWPLSLLSYVDLQVSINT